MKKHILLALGGITTALTLSACGPSGSSSTPAASAGNASTPAAEAPKVAAAPAGDLVDITPEYPKALFIGTPVPTGSIANLEKPDPEAVKKRLTLKVPKGTENVAKGKKVTSSDSLPIIGTLDLITDGDADGADGNYVELSPGLQWVQIDLGAEYNVWKVLLWHFHKQTAVYFKTVVQLSDDPEFKTGVTTLFNNDKDNANKLGAGTDMNYIETNHGRLIEGSGAKGRYVRCYSNGNSANEMNHYIEVQVYGTPAK